jgi:hypothetical protein
LLAAEDVGRQAKPTEHERERVDRGVEEAEVELASRHRLRRHPEAAKDPGADADARQRAARDDQPSSELRPRRPRAGPRCPSALFEQVLGIDDPQPREHIAVLGQNLQRDPSKDPFPGDVLDAAGRLLDAWKQVALNSRSGRPSAT